MVRVVFLVTSALLALTAGSDARPIRPHQQLLQDRKIAKQLELIEKLVRVMLNVTNCGGGEAMVDGRKRGDVEDGEGKREDVKDGEGKRGEVEDGEGKRGEVEDGEGKRGEVEDGEGKRGEVEDGEGKRGEVEDGEGKRGEVEDGEGKRGEVEDGEGKRGEVEDGEGKRGEVEDGEGKREDVEDGEGKREDVEDGEGKQGEVEDGEEKQEDVEDGEGKRDDVEDGEEKQEDVEDGEGKRDDVEDGEGKREDVTDGEGKQEDVEDGEGKRDDVEDGEEKQEDVEDGEGKRDDVEDGEGKREDVTDGEGKQEDVEDGEGKREDVADGEGKQDDVEDGEEKQEDVADGEGKREDVVDGEGKREDVEDGEGKQENVTESGEIPTNTTDAPAVTEPSECDYSEISPEHTALKEESQCEIHKTGLTLEERQLVLDLHNEFRAKVARGEEDRGDPGPQPPAANMRELVWNEELAHVAQAWAGQCPRGHDRARNRMICSRDYHVGQNIHYYWGFNEDPDWERAVNEWYVEVADMPNTFATSFRLLSNKKIGHYTQVVWADTSEVGCGVVHFETEVKGKLYPESKTYVCNYGKAGNIRDRPLYKTGTAASQCPNGVSPNYPDLCL